uniref:Uncharacterized protein n=1 Tax=Anguilla anguilla TaxID=7936 RepID=A0A0E9U131_ANGAN
MILQHCWKTAPFRCGIAWWQAIGLASAVISPQSTDKSHRPSR